MVAEMAERRPKAITAKVNLGVRVLPDRKARLEEIAAEISKDRWPATVTAAELAAAAIDQFIERYERGGTSSSQAESSPSPSRPRK